MHALPWSQPDRQLVGLHQGRVAGSHRHHGEAAGGRTRNHLVVPGGALPDQGRRRARCCISGPATVTIKEWLAPTLGSRPHDSHAAADGSIWWTGQFASKLGRLDPRTGQIREFDLPAKSQPHGLAEDRPGQHLVHGHSEGRDRPARPTHRASATSIRSTSRAHAARTRRFWTSAAATCSSRCSRDTSAGSTPPAATW